MHIRRSLILFCTLIAVLCALVFPTFAAEETAEQVLIDSCLYGETVDVSAFSLTQDSLNSLFNQLLNDGKLPWYTTSSFQCSIRDDTKTVVSFTPMNLDPAKYDYAAYEAQLMEIMDACILEGMTPEQIALSVHDYLALNTVYDESMQANTAYDLVVNGTSVCAGYAVTYMDILNRAGVPCVQVTSEAMEHAWNLVQIDGNWYHVDVTWDDPSPDVSGYVSHQYFMITDDQIAAGDKPHYDWVSNIKCTDSRYENAYWKDLTSAVFFNSSAESYLLRSENYINKIYRRNNSGQETLIYTDSQSTADLGSGLYAYSHNGLALRNNRLWFGTLNGISSINTNGSDLRQEYTYDTSKNSRFIYSFFPGDGTLYLTTADHQGNLQSETDTLPVAAGHTHSFTKEVIAGNCEEAGYTLSTCQCGVSIKSNPTAPVHALVSSLDGTQESCTLCGYTRNTVQQYTYEQMPESLDIPYGVIFGGIAVVLLLILLLRPKKKKRRR